MSSFTAYFQSRDAVPNLQTKLSTLATFASANWSLTVPAGTWTNSNGWNVNTITVTLGADPRSQDELQRHFRDYATRILGFERVAYPDNGSPTEAAVPCY